MLKFSIADAQTGRRAASYFTATSVIMMPSITGMVIPNERLCVCKLFLQTFPTRKPGFSATQLFLSSFKRVLTGGRPRGLRSTHLVIFVRGVVAKTGPNNPPHYPELGNDSTLPLY